MTDNPPIIPCTPCGNREPQLNRVSQMGILRAGGWRVECAMCGQRGESLITDTAAIESWNQLQNNLKARYKHDKDAT